MDNQHKLKFTKLLDICRSKSISDVSGEPFFFPETNHHRQLIALFSPLPHSLSKPKCHNNNNNNNKNTNNNNDNNNKPKTSHKTQTKATKKKPRYRKPKKIECISSTTDSYYYDWRSSDDEENIVETETTLISSSSVSPRVRNRANGKLLKDTFAVEKKSMSPYEDFKVSMVEMIVEKKIYGAEELNNLFECFISLNSEEHHRVIFEVFSDILEALFSGSD